MNAREDIGELAPAEQDIARVESSEARAARADLQLLYDQARSACNSFEEKVKKEPGNWMWVQLYAEWWAELEISRRAIAAVGKRS
jgi:hypothetical protein